MAARAALHKTGARLMAAPLFRGPRVGWALLFGFSSGLPQALTAATMTAWLTVEKVRVETIGLFALVSLPYSLKPLWAPLVDRFGPSWRGRPARRRAWVLGCQFGLASAVLAAGTAGPGTSPSRFALLSLTIALLSATQDIAIDGWRADLLDAGERGPGASLYVAGYRAAMLVSGALALMLASRVSFPMIYGGVAALLLLATALPLRAPEPAAVAAPPSLREAIVRPLTDLAARRSPLSMLGVVALFKVGDGVLAHLLPAFLVGRGYAMADVGAINQGLGLAATIAGALAGGAAAARIGLQRALLAFGALTALTNLGYVALAALPVSRGALALVVGLDQLASGLGAAAFVAFLTSLCDARYSATQYALLTALSGLGGRLLGAAGGALVARAGWTALFLGTIAITLPALALIPRLPPDEDRAHR